ncbi:MAG: M55 family metallopeptidase [Pseudomonadota bacterium]
MKLYVSADIEGVAGVVSPDQTLQTGFEYETARRWMTEETLAVCEAALDNGVTHIVVSDSHGNGQNLLLDAFPSSVEIVRNWPRPLGMMQGIEDGDYVGAILLGYHTGAHHSGGVLAHTMAGRIFTELRLNGRPASETMLSAAIAGHFATPVLMATGDRDYVIHAEELLGDIVCVETKTGYGRISARTLTPNAACEKLAAAVPKALDRRGRTPFKIETPVVLEVDFQRHLGAELLSYLPGVERTASKTIRFEGADMTNISKFLAVVAHYSYSL